MSTLPMSITAAFAQVAASLHFADVRAGNIVMSDHGDGQGIWLTKWDIDAPIPTDAEVAAAISAIEAGKPAISRKAAYLRESDALVIRAVRLQLAGDPGADAAKDEALAKVAEIKARLPDLEAK